MLQLHDEVKEISIEIQTSTGSFPALFSAVTVETDGQEQLINAAIFKISDRKKYEAELLKEKNLVKEDNDAKAQILDEVAFNQAHLIRAPLANILGLIDLLEEGQELDSDNKNLIVKLKASAFKLDRVVTEIVGLIH